MSDSDAWRGDLADAGELTPDIVQSILDIHGSRGVKAIEAVGEHRVKEYKDFLVVVGTTDEYIIEDQECTCPDSQYNLDSDDPSQLCWHVLASIIARELGEVDRHDIWYSEVKEFL